MSVDIGDKVGAYQIQELLGQGGMATVYRAYHTVLDRSVALKVINTSHGLERSVVERFLREARIIARLDNEHIVPVYEFNEHEDQPYLVLKLIDGQTLRERLKASPLSNSEIFDIVMAVGDGLQYAHGQGVLHRDIKPSNILIARDGHIYITDFGLARFSEMESNLTGDAIIGTPHYMSPEQALSKEQLDAGTDIYSFGIMIYEMVVGQLPFTSDDPFTVIGDHLYHSPPSPKSIRPDLADEVEEVILKTLEKDPSNRYETVADLVNAFARTWGQTVHHSISSSTTSESYSFSALLADNGKAFPLASEKTILGRNSSTKNILNDIDLSELDSRKVISRRHAMVEKQGKEYFIYDLNSRNGTFWNSIPVVPGEPKKLASGDVIELGRGGVKLIFSQ